jgi:proteasome assembly chaperone (PAC2) family protein
VEHVRWHSDLQPRRPVVVAGFTGWNDGADAASNAMRTMIEAWDATLVASIDPEEFTDFASIRPHVRLADGVTREIVWPQVAVWCASTPGGDVLLVLGPEPSLRWRAFTDQLVEITKRFDARLVVSLGALLADVSHRSDVHLIGTATDPELIDRFELQRSQYEGPTGIVGVLQDACSTAGIPSASLWAATPAYSSQIPSPKAAIALVRRACEIIGTPAPVAALESEVEDYESSVDELIETDEELRESVRHFDWAGDDDDPGQRTEGDLIEELEQYLRDQDGSA